MHKKKIDQEEAKASHERTVCADMRFIAFDLGGDAWRCSECTMKITTTTKRKQINCGLPSLHWDVSSGYTTARHC